MAACFSGADPVRNELDELPIVADDTHRAVAGAHQTARGVYYAVQGAAQVQVRAHADHGVEQRSQPLATCDHVAHPIEQFMQQLIEVDARQRRQAERRRLACLRRRSATPIDFSTQHGSDCSYLSSSNARSARRSTARRSPTQPSAGNLPASCRRRPDRAERACGRRSVGVRRSATVSSPAGRCAQAHHRSGYVSRRTTSVITWWNSAGFSKSGWWPDFSKTMNRFLGAWSRPNHSSASTARSRASCRPCTR